MPQVTWRTHDELLERVRLAAARSGRSVNAWISRVLDAATDPDLAGSDLDGLRERLIRAGLLEQLRDQPVGAPDSTQLGEARARAATGTPLSDLVRNGRG